ncbi:MAG TPA: type II CAAX endopeptidase family protein [Anaerolineales bacterium]|nr:type II CAAX endopeptidase family protein [Anaerolineales bacterium]
MKTINEFLKRHSLVAGILLMFLFTWPFDLAMAGLLPFKVPYVISITFGWGISIAALLITGLTLGRRGIIQLLRRFLIWRVGWKWVFAALFLYPVVFSLAVLLHSVWIGVPIDFSGVFAHKIFGASANLPMFILPFFIYDFLTNGEELGWRGYVLPRLQAKHGALVSSLIVGVIWGFWHFPRFLAPGNTGSFALMMIKVLADAVIYTWVYNNTQGSLLLTTVLHAAGNTAGVFLPVANTQSGEHLDVYILATVFLIIIAIAVTFFSGSKQLSRVETVQVQS